MRKCSNSIIHCNECENAEKCIKCESDFYFINNETIKCYNFNEILPINEYYLDENNLSYYSCNDTKFNSIKNCKECNKKDSCYLCNDNYTFINGNKSKCYEISELGEEYIIDLNDKSNYIKCSDFINNCILCNSTICFNCDEGYIFVNDDFNNCLLKSSLDLSNYLNSNYILKNYIEVNNNELFSIISNEQNIFTMVCPIIRKNKHSNRLSKTSIVIIIIAAIFIAIIFTIIIYIFYKKFNKNKELNPNIGKVDSSNSNVHIIG